MHAVGKTLPSAPSATPGLSVLCSALANAVTEELIPKNVAALLHVPKPGKRKVKPWTVDKARRFPESAKRDHDPLYAACVLILILGLRKGEVVGLPWSAVNLGGAGLDVGWQLQLIRRELLHRETKTEASDATRPLPGICVAALRSRAQDQAEARAQPVSAGSEAAYREPDVGSDTGSPLGGRDGELAAS